MADQTTVIGPSALLNESSARSVLKALEVRDVSSGGVWSAQPGEVAALRQALGRHGRPQGHRAPHRHHRDRVRGPFRKD